MKPVSMIAIVFALAGCASPLLTRQVEFEDGAGENAWELEPKEDGSVELETADGLDLAEYDVRPEGVAFKMNGVTKLLVSPTEGGDGLVVRNRDDGVSVYKFLREPDGDWKLKDAEGNTIQEVKRKTDYPYKIEGGPAREQKVKLRGDEIVIKDENGNTSLSTSVGFPALSLACLGLDTVNLEIRAGLALAILRYGLSDEWPATGREQDEVSR